MPIEYFGNNSTAGSDSNLGSGPYVVCLRAYTGPTWDTYAVCPGTGAMRLVSLECYSINTGAQTGYSRLALYEQNLDDPGYEFLVCQGSAKFHSSTTRGWNGHTSFVDANGDPIIPVLVGGRRYFIELSMSGSDERCTAVGPEADQVETISIAGIDFTDGFPSGGTPLSFRYYLEGLRAGVIPHETGDFTLTHMRWMA